MSFFFSSSHTPFPMIDQTRNEMEAIAAKMAAQRALRSPEGEAARMYDEEQKRLAEEKRSKEEEEKRQKQASRERLLAKAAAFQGGSPTKQ